MKTLSRVGFVVAFVCGAAAVVRANDYKSVVIQGNTSLTSPIDVSGDRFLVIRNFTQQGGTVRGTVNVTIGTQTITVLTASILPADSTTTLEPVNSIVISGPATVTVTCGSDATTCFVTYRKESDQ